MSILEFLSVIVLICVLFDFWLKDKPSAKFEIAIRFLQFEETLKRNGWARVQRRVVRSIIRFHYLIFGQRVISLRFFLSVFLLSALLTSAASVAALHVMSNRELRSAGFRDVNTPLGEKLFEQFVEVFDKTHALFPIYGINALFDFLTIIVSLCILRSIYVSRGPVKPLILISLDIIFSIICMLLISNMMVLFQYLGFAGSKLGGRPTTNLVAQPTSLLFISGTVVIPVLAYSFVLFVVAFTRFAMLALESVSSRLADDSQTVFTQFAVFLSAVIGASSGFLKILALLFSAMVYAAGSIKEPLLLGFLVFTVSVWAAMMQLFSF